MKYDNGCGGEFGGVNDSRVVPTGKGTKVLADLLTSPILEGAGLQSARPPLAGGAYVAALALPLSG